MEKRVYSANEIDACLQFVRLEVNNTIPQNSDAPQQPSWWPCLLFQNMVELTAISKQLGLWDNIPQGQMLFLYTKHMPASATCRVALVLGDSPPLCCMFDAAPTPLDVVPFLANVFEFNMRYAMHTDYMNAVGVTMPMLVAMASHAQQDPSPPANVAVNCNDEDRKAAATGGTQEPVEKAAVVQGVASFEKRAGADEIVTTPEAKRRKYVGTIHAPPPTPHGPVSHADGKDGARCQDEGGTEDADDPIARTLRSHTKQDVSQSDASTDPSSATLEVPRRSAVQPPTRSRNTPLTKRNAVNSGSSSGGRTLAPSSVTMNTAATQSSGKRKQAPSLSDPKSSSKKKGSEQTYDVKIPAFSQVRDALRRGGYTFGKRNNQFCRPSGAAFSTVEELRRDLCFYGVDCACGSTEERRGCDCWSESEKWKIKEWVRYEVIRGTVRSGPVRLIEDRRTARMLLRRLGFKHLRSVLFDGDVFPGVSTARGGTLGVTMFSAENEMWKFLSRAGLPENCDFEQLTNDERFDLEFFLSTTLSRVPTL